MRVMLLALWLLAPALALADPSADEILRGADTILAPEEYESEVTFVTHKGPDQARTFSLHVLKKGTDQLRVTFISPPDDKGAEFLRLGDDMWNYLPNLKRALKIPPKQEFHGGDFANADILRVDLAQDYVPTILPSDSSGQWLLDLRAKTDQVAYARIKYWIRKGDLMPLREEFYTASGKLVRKLEIKKTRAFGGITRPSHLVMQNLLIPSRFSEMIVDNFTLRKGIDRSLFDLGALGR